MSRAFHLRDQRAFSPGLLLSIVGATLMLIGFFLPFVFWQGIGSVTPDGQMSQWEMIVIDSTLFSHVWLLWAAEVIPLLSALTGLAMSIIVLLLRQHHPRLARWKHFIATPGAILELLVGPFEFFLSGIEGAKIFPGPGLVFLLPGSLILLVGLHLERRSRNVGVRDQRNSESITTL